MGANNQKLWLQLCDADGPPRAAGRRRASPPSRCGWPTGRRCEDELEKTFRQQTKDHWVETLLAAGIPAGPDPELPRGLRQRARARRASMRMEIDHPVEGKVPNIGFPVKLSGTPQQVRRHPPLLGEHTDEVLAELGIDARRARAAARRRERSRHERRRRGPPADRRRRRRASPSTGPQARNAMTWAMYERLRAICEQLRDDRGGARGALARRRRRGLRRRHRHRAVPGLHATARTAWPTSAASTPASR